MKLSETMYAVIMSDETVVVFRTPTDAEEFRSGLEKWSHCTLVPVSVDRVVAVKLVEIQPADAG